MSAGLIKEGAGLALKGPKEKGSFGPLKRITY